MDTNQKTEEKSIFSFKKAKKKVGDFDTDDPQEWVLLHKPQIGDVTLFVHFHKLWCVTEVQGDEENGIQEVKKAPGCEIYTGFLKEDKFVVEKRRAFVERIDDLANKHLLRDLQQYLDMGFTKDYNNYLVDVPVTPNYYEQPVQDKSGSMLGGAIKRPHIMLGGNSLVKTRVAQRNQGYQLNTANMIPVQAPPAGSGDDEEDNS